jgi:hypothetical protein
MCVESWHLVSAVRTSKKLRQENLKSHTSSCFPNTDDLSIERIEKLAIDMEEASFETFSETLKETMQWSRLDRDAQGDPMLY